MPDSIARLNKIKKRHNNLSRGLTIAIAALFCGVGGVLWLTDVPLLDRYKMIVGSVLMFGAFVFYNIPYIAYRINYRNFSGCPDDQQLIGQSWREYRQRILNR